MMRKIIWGAVICVSLFSVTGMTAEPEKEKAAVAAAEKWLKMVDQGKYSQSWQEAAQYFKNAVKKEQWVATLKAVRKPLGKLIQKTENQDL